MAERTWQPFPGEDCEACGSDVEVLTDAGDGFACDGDDVRCTECGLRGCVNAEEDWDEDDEPVCEAWIDWEFDEELEATDA